MSVILEGPIPGAGVAPLLQAVAIGRQTSAIRLFDEGRELGQLWLRSGKVLAAEFGHAEGADALRRILSQRAGSFAVSNETLPTLPEPIGDLRTMLAELGGGHAQVSLLRGLAPRARDTGVQALPAVPAPEPAPPRLVQEPPVASSVPVASSSPPPVATPVASAPTLHAAGGLPRSLSQDLLRAPRRISSVPPPAAPAVVRPLTPAIPISRAAVPAPKPTVEPAPAPERAAPAGARARAVAIASAKGGVGKTTVALNTAVALARRGLRVTLIDADPSGGVSAAVNAHTRRTTGTFDVLCGVLRLSDALIESRLSSLRVLPAGGAGLSMEQIENAQNHRAAWQLLLDQASRDADVVLVDTPAGAFGPTRVILGCVTHALGVLQAEPIAMRVSDQLQRALATTTPAPKLLGFVVNMFDSRSSASAQVLQEACRVLPAGQVFDTPIPRTHVINEASVRGVVPAQADLATAPAIAWAFEQLAAELLSRLEVERPVAVLDESPLF